MTEINAGASKLPPDWSVRRIDEIARIMTGSRNTQDRVEDGLYPFFVRSQEVERINTWSFDGEAVLTAGDGVGTGKVFHYIDGKFDCHQRVYRIAEFDEAIDGFFFFKQFSQNFFDRIMSMTAKSSVDSVRREMIAGMEILVPPIEEQAAIAQALSDIDDLIASLDALIAKKRDIKQGAMQELLTGKRRLPGFSGQWTRVKICQAFDFLRNGSHARDAFVPNGEIFCAHYGAIHAEARSHVSPQNFPRLPASLASGLPFAQDGDLMLADVSEDLAGIGKSVEITSIKHHRLVAGLHTVLLRPKSGFIAQGYAGFLQFVPQFKEGLIRIANGISVYGVSKTPLREVEIDLPAIDEQAEIAATLLEIGSEISPLEKKRRKMAALREGMMQQLLTGRIRLS